MRHADTLHEPQGVARTVWISRELLPNPCLIATEFGVYQRSQRFRRRLQCLRSLQDHIRLNPGELERGKVGGTIEQTLRHACLCFGL